MGELNKRIEAIAIELTEQEMLTEVLCPEYKKDLASWLDTNVNLGKLHLLEDSANAIKAVTLGAFLIGHAYALKHGDIRKSCC